MATNSLSCLVVFKSISLPAASSGSPKPLDPIYFLPGLLKRHSLFWLNYHRRVVNIFSLLGTGALLARHTFLARQGTTSEKCLS